MFLPYLLILLPVLIHASINIDVFVDALNHATVDFSGKIDDIISDAERNTFGLSDDFLMRATTAYYGKSPTGVYVRSPTSSTWQDLYSTYIWQQVTRTIVPESVRILEVKEQKTILDTKFGRNNTTMTSTFNALFTKIVQNNLTSSWDTNGGLTVGQNEINIGVSRFSLKPTTFRWGEKASNSENVTLVNSTGGYVFLSPGESVRGDLTASKVTMTIEVNYAATLTGYVVANFYYKHNGHHFWAVPVNQVMKAGGLNNILKSRQLITVEFYSKVVFSFRNK